jgi:fatty acid desaturase
MTCCMAASCGERRRLEALLSLSMSWMTPTLWQAVHDREHHQNTNDLRDPDRAYLQALPRNWGKRRSEERLMNLPLQQP